MRRPGAPATRGGVESRAGGRAGGQGSAWTKLGGAPRALRGGGEGGSAEPPPQPGRKRRSQKTETGGRMAGCPRAAPRVGKPRAVRRQLAGRTLLRRSERLSWAVGSQVEGRGGAPRVALRSPGFLPEDPLKSPRQMPRPGVTEPPGSAALGGAALQKGPRSIGRVAPASTYASGRLSPGASGKHQDCSNF